MQQCRLISSPAHDSPPARIDLNKAPEFRAYMANDDEILFVCRPVDVQDCAKHLTRLGAAVEIGPAPTPARDSFNEAIFDIV